MKYLIDDKVKIINNTCEHGFAIDEMVIIIPYSEDEDDDFDREITFNATNGEEEWFLNIDDFVLHSRGSLYKDEVSKEMLEALKITWDALSTYGNHLLIDKINKRVIEQANDLFKISDLKKV